MQKLIKLVCSLVLTSFIFLGVNAQVDFTLIETNIDFKCDSAECSFFDNNLVSFQEYSCKPFVLKTDKTLIADSLFVERLRDLKGVLLAFNKSERASKALRSVKTDHSYLVCFIPLSDSLIVKSFLGNFESAQSVFTVCSEGNILTLEGSVLREKYISKEKTENCGYCISYFQFSTTKIENVEINDNNMECL
jgi:hypothetical protein